MWKFNDSATVKCSDSHSYVFSGASTISMDTFIAAPEKILIKIRGKEVALSDLIEKNENLSDLITKLNYLLKDQEKRILKLEKQLLQLSTKKKK